EGHIDGDVLLTFGYVVEADFIDQAEIDDVDGDFGIVALLECVQNVILGEGHEFPLRFVRLRSIGTERACPYSIANSRLPGARAAAEMGSAWTGQRPVT